MGRSSMVLLPPLGHAFIVMAVLTADVIALVASDSELWVRLRVNLFAEEVELPQSRELAVWTYECIQSCI